MSILQIAKNTETEQKKIEGMGNTHLCPPFKKGRTNESNFQLILIIV